MKTPLEVYLEHGVDVESRRIFLLGDVEEDSVAKIVKALYLMGNSEKQIELVLSSLGGSDYDMFGLYDVIQGMKCEVKTVAFGKVMSAAVLLGACGDRRVCYRHTSFMVHDTSFGDEGKLPTMKRVVEHYENRTRLWCELMAQHSNLNIGQWRRMISKNHDVYFEAEQALEYGIVDEIVGG